MRISYIRIQNFKSIKDTGIVKISSGGDITILAGQNESGKSSILEALDFFENGPGPDFDDLQRQLETSPRVEVGYVFDSEDLKRIIESSSSKTLGEYLKKNGLNLARGNVEKDDFDNIKYINPSELNAIIDKLSNPVKEDGNEEGSANEDEEKLSFNFFKLILSQRPKFIFYSSFDENILPSKITKDQIPSNQAVQDFEKVFQVNFTSLLEETNDALRLGKLNKINANASDNLNEYWSQKVEEGRSSYRFNIDAVPQHSSPAESYLRFYIDQGDGFLLHFGQKSKGFQWFSSFNLRLRAHEVSGENLNNFILLIDEPGQGLHEEAQKDVKKVLNELASKGVQVIFSTHQAQLLRSTNEVDFSRIKLVTRSTQGGTKINNIAQSSTANGFKDALSPVRTAMGLVSIDVETMLGGSSTIIVEGITDHYYLKAFNKLLPAKSNDKSFVTIPCVGVDQAPNIYSILLGWGIASKCIVDDDRKGNAAMTKIKKNLLSDMDSQSIEEVLYTNTGCVGIEDTFTPKDFLRFAGAYVQLDKSKKNSELAKGNKEIIGRELLEKVDKEEIKLKDLEKLSQENITKIIKFARS